MNKYIPDEAAGRVLFLLLRANCISFGVTLSPDFFPPPALPFQHRQTEPCGADLFTSRRGLMGGKGEEGKRKGEMEVPPCWSLLQGGHFLHGWAFKQEKRDKNCL